MIVPRRPGPGSPVAAIGEPRRPDDGARARPPIPIGGPSWAGEAYLESVGLVARLLRIHLLFGRLLDDVTSAERINDTDYLVLALIERSPGGGSPSHIAEVLRRSTGGMTLTLDRLESLGWLSRAPDPSDRRRIRLHLTDAGRHAIDQVRAALHGWEDDLDLDDDTRSGGVPIGGRAHRIALPTSPGPVTRASQLRGFAGPSVVRCLTGQRVRWRLRACVAVMAWRSVSLRYVSNAQPGTPSSLARVSTSVKGEVSMFQSSIAASGSAAASAMSARARSIVVSMSAHSWLNSSARSAGGERSRRASSMPSMRAPAAAVGSVSAP